VHIARNKKLKNLRSLQRDELAADLHQVDVIAAVAYQKRQQAISLITSKHLHEPDCQSYIFAACGLKQ
jgi:hypothetical protein